MTKGRSIPDDRYKVNEIDRGNGIKEIIYVREASKPKELQAMEIKPRGKIIQLQVRRKKRKSKWHELLIVGIPSALFVNGLIWLKELLLWNNGILYRPYWLVTFGLIAFIGYANIVNRPSR